MRSKAKKITYIDLFAGAGGLSEGFASAGYQPVAHVEMDKDACDTLKTRESYYYLNSVGKRDAYLEYLKGHLSKEQLWNLAPTKVTNSVICETMGDTTMASVFSKIDTSMKEKRISKIDVILGGPPCQAYSTVGRSRKNMEGDPRNTLYKYYFQVLEKYKPEVFVFENVPGLLTAGSGTYLQAIIEGFKIRGYKLEYHVLNAADYGVLQNRKRIILVGWRSDTEHFYPELRKQKQSYLVADLFQDLPPLTPGHKDNKYFSDEFSRYLQASGIRKKNDVLTWHEARPNQDRDREIYRLAVQAWKKNHTRLKYTDVPDRLATHNNRSSFLDRFKVVADDLPASHTLVAHISKDGHYYIHPDIIQVRSISVREAARIQSFPDDFFFEGSRTAALRQIGNAVPPLFAKEIALSLLDQFGG